MPIAKARLSLAFGFLLFLPTAITNAAEPAFVGKFALIADPEVAKELGLTDDVKKKLLELIDKREQEAIGVAAKLKGQPAAKQAEALAPFVAESERLGKALLDDSQLAKLDKLKVAKDGMVGILSPDMIGKLQITDDQKKEIALYVEEYKGIMARGSEFQKRFARTSYEKKIAGLLTDTQRGSWEQLSGAPAGGSAVAQAAPPAAPPGPGGATAPAGPGGVNVQRAGGVAELEATETGEYKMNFVLTPWKNVLEYFAKKGGYAFTTEKWPTGTLNYTDPRTYTADQVIDVFNLHLMSKGFILVKKEKLLRLWDTANDGPVPPEYVPEITPDELPNYGEYSVLTVYFQLDKWPPSEAEAEIKKRLGPYGSITVLNSARQLIVTELGGRLRWIKRTIDEVEKPTSSLGKDDRLVLIKLNRLTPTEFMTNVRQLMNIPDGQWGTADGNLRLSVNELDSLIICSGKLPQIERVQDLAKQLDGYAPPKTAGGSIAIVEQPQFGVYEIRSADPVFAENVIRTLLAGVAPDLKIQLDQKTAKLSVWGKPAQHQQVQAILFNLEQNGDITEVIRLKRLNPQDAMTGINQVVNGDPSGKGNGTGVRVSVDALTSLLTLRGTPAKVEEAKSWLAKMGEPIELFAGQPGGRMPNMPDDRAAIRVLPLSSRTLKQVLEEIPYHWGEGRPKVRIQEINSDQATPPASEAPKPASVIPPAAKKAAEPAPKAAPTPAPNSDARPWPKSDQPAIRPAKPATPKTRDLTDTGSTVEPAYFVSAPAETTDAPPADQPTVPPEQPAETPKAEAPPAPEEADPNEILVRVTPKGIVITSQNLDALDQFEEMLQELVHADDRRGKRTEVFALKHKDADVAANMLKAMIDGGANIADGGLGGLANILGGPLGSMMGMFGGGGGQTSAGGSVSGTTSGTPANITPDMTLNVLYVTGLPRDLDNIEALIKLIDKEESPDPPVAARPRFIPVLNSKAADVAVLVREQFAGQIYGESSGNRGGMQIQPQEVLAAMITGGRGGPGGRGGFGGGRGGQQQNMGEKKKIMISVATETNSLIVTAPDHLFEDVEAFVKMVDLENVIPDATVRVVKIRQVNSDALYTSLASMTGQNATVARVLPFNSQNLAGRGGQTGNVVSNQQQQQGGRQGQQGNQQLNPQLLNQMQQFNQGQRGGNRGQGGFGQGGFGGNPFGGGGGNRGGGFGGQPGGFGGGNFGGGNRGGGGGQPGGFGGGNFGGGNRGGGGGQPGGFGGGNRGGGGGGGPGGGRGGIQ